MSDIIVIHVTDLKGKVHRIEAPTGMGLNLMEAIRMNELPIKALCGGIAMCASCNVIITSDHELSKIKETEEEMLDQAFVLDVPNSRLSCQIPISSAVDGLKVQLGALTDPEE